MDFDIKKWVDVEVGRLVGQGDSICIVIQSKCLTERAVYIHVYPRKKLNNKRLEQLSCILMAWLKTDQLNAAKNSFLHPYTYAALNEQEDTSK